MGWFDRFTKPLWGANGQIVEPVDTQANAGFAFLGDEPPSVELFNAVFQWLDGKDKWLYSQIISVLTRSSITPTEGNVTALRDALIDQFQDARQFPSTLRRNYIGNSQFGIVQRGLGPHALTGDIGIDRWFNFGAGVNFSIETKIATEADQIELGDYRLLSYARVTVGGGGGANSLATIAQRMENVMSLAGSAATFSLAVRRVSGAGNIGFELLQLWGPSMIEGGGNQVVGIGSQQIPVTGVWTKRSIGANVPPPSGRVAAGANRNCLQLALWFSAGSNYAARSGNIGNQNATFDISLLQLEPGTKATNYDFVPGDIEYLRCLRHYSIISYVDGINFRNIPNSNLSSQAGFAYHSSIPMALPMPTPILRKSVWGVSMADGVSTFNDVSFTQILSDNTNHRVIFNHSGAFPVGQPWILNDINVMGLDAELR